MGERITVLPTLICSGFIGLRLDTTRDEMLRAVVESIAFSMMRVVEGFMSETGSSLERIVVDGGVARNDFIVQMIADLTGEITSHTHGINSLSDHD